MGKSSAETALCDAHAMTPNTDDLSPSQWTRIHDLILEGVAPEEALAASRSEVEAPTWTHPAAGLNWLWFTALSPQAVVVDLGSPAAEFSYHAAGRATSVLHITSPPFAGLAAPRLAPFATATVSTNTAYPPSLPPPSLVYFSGVGRWRDRVPRELENPSRLTKWAVGLLQPRGWFVALLPNPFYRPHGSPDPLGRLAGLRTRVGLIRVLKRAGLEPVRALYLTGHPARPTALVPANSKAVRAFLSILHGGPSLSITVRSMTHPAQFPSLLIMSQR